MTMKTMVRSNWALLRDRFPNLFQQIKDIEPNEQALRLRKAKKTGDAILERYDGQRWLSLYSKFDPMEESERWAASVDGNPRHIVMFGFGLGYHFEALATRFPDTRFHLIEPDPQLFIHYIEEKGLSASFITNVDDVILSDRVEDYQAFCKAIIHFIDESWVFLSPPKFERVYPEHFKTYTDAFMKSKADYTDLLLSLHSFEKVWNLNALRNLPQVFQSPNIFDFKEQFQGKPVILTASGPSLNDAISFIKRMQETEKAIVVAAGTSVNGLLNKGIKPDLFVSYDPFIDNYKSMKNVLDKDIPFVFGSTIQADLAAEYKGPKAHMITSPDKLACYLDPSLNPNHVVQDGPTITAVALDLLEKLGVDTVYLAGQDLCFIDEKAGAEGVYFYNKEGRVNEEHLKGKQYIENNNGDMAPTNPSFLKMKTFIEDLIARMDGRMSMYSLSRFGARIKGMPYRSAEEAEADLSEKPPVTFHFPSNQSERPGEIEDALLRVNEAIMYFSEVKEVLGRQLQRFHAAPSAQKEKWREKVDKSLDRMTGHVAFQHVIYPLVTNRIHYMVRLKSNSDFSDMKQVEDYFNEGVCPLVEELTVVLNEYQAILSDYNAGKVI